MISLLTAHVWKNISSEAAKCKAPAHVAVAYFSSTGDRLLPIPKGSSMVVDASIATLAVGSTSPAALERLRKKGVDIYSAQDLHAKVYAFDNVVFIGSANASHRSATTLIEAVVQLDTKAAILSARSFVESLCLTKLSGSDLAELSQYYKPPKIKSFIGEQAKYSTLLMELTREQGGKRVTQVQPPMGVWINYFGLKTDAEKLPTFSLINESHHSHTQTERDVVKHHHNFTIELPGTELPRPAILQMRRIAKNKYSYRVHRPSDSTYGAIRERVLTVHNPLWSPGRRWVLV